MMNINEITQITHFINLKKNKEKIMTADCGQDIESGHTATTNPNRKNEVNCKNGCLDKEIIQPVKLPINTFNGMNKPSKLKSHVVLAVKKLYLLAIGLKYNIKSIKSAFGMVLRKRVPHTKLVIVKHTIQVKKAEKEIKKEVFPRFQKAKYLVSFIVFDGLFKRQFIKTFKVSGYKQMLEVSKMNFKNKDRFVILERNQAVRIA